MTYEQAYKDHETLWNIGPADDMTGAYVDQDDLEKMLRNPTKSQAKECLCNQIEHWFDWGHSELTECWSIEYAIREHPEVEAIAKRHKII